MKYPDISKAVEQEILASYEKLYRLAFSYVKNEQDAMDVVQESVYKAMKNASQIKEKKYIKTWLWRIVINTAVDATRRQSRFRFRRKDRRIAMRTRISWLRLIRSRKKSVR